MSLQQIHDLARDLYMSTPYILDKRGKIWRIKTNLGILNTNDFCIRNVSICPKILKLQLAAKCFRITL